jgi:tetraacyldisaccharide 4'-kinase
MFFLWPFEIIYRIVIAIRNIYFDSFYKEPNKNKSPLCLSVGNLSAGGTGKTPICLKLIELSQTFAKTGVLLRGYKADKNANSDEAMIYSNYLDHQNVYVGADRLKSLEKAKSDKVKIAVLDDAFQHRKIGRELNIVLIDCTQPPQKDHCFPRGFLREPISSLQRADILVLTRSDLVDNSIIKSIETDLKQKFSHLKLFKSQMDFSHFNYVSGEKPTSSKQKFILVSGIGNPDSFNQSVLKQEVELVNTLVFQDHYEYSQNDLENIKKETEKHENTAVLTTEKDWVKWKKFNFNFPVAIFVAKAKILTMDDQQCDAELLNIIEDKLNMLSEEHD